METHLLLQCAVNTLLCLQCEELVRLMRIVADAFCLFRDVMSKKGVSVFSERLQTPVLHLTSEKPVPSSNPSPPLFFSLLGYTLLFTPIL